MNQRGLETGTILAGRFRIERRIGAGGMGQVYAAEQLGLDRSVAIKVISPQDALQPLARRRFEREARIASALRHPNAVEIYDFGLHQGRMYLVMELLRGPSLRSLVDLDLPPLKPRRACQIAADVASVLASAAAIGVMHRDLKPENIILDRTNADERTVVVDFGLAFINESESTGRVTRDGEGVGTPDYLSPEQARGAELTPACDVYSLGCVLYEMLTSRPPFDGRNAVILSQHLFVAPTPIREIAPGLEVPHALDDLVLRMLSKSPEDRPSALALYEALHALDPSASTQLDHSACGQRLGRSARMVSETPIEDSGQTLSGDLWLDTDIQVAVRGDIDADLEIGLAANGIQVVDMDHEPDAIPLGVLAIFAPGAAPDEVARLVESGLPVVGDSDPSDIERLADMLRAGASEVVIRPCAPEEVARKVWRAIRKG